MSLRVVLLLIGAASLGAWTQAHACGELSHYEQVLRCAEKTSFEVLRADSELRYKELARQGAGQLLNPDLNLESVSGDSGTDKKTETDVTLMFPLELGGKSQARRDIATAEVLRAENALLLARTNIRRQVYLNLLRLRHWQAEQNLLEESLETFSKLVRQYESRPTRSPEQEVSLAVYRIASADYKLKKVEAEEELAHLESFFRLNTPYAMSQINKVLPTASLRWPTIESLRGDFRQSVLMAAHEADLRLAQAELESQKSESWPTLLLGPAAKFSSSGGQSEQQYGLGLSMPLPLLSLNQAGRRSAVVGVQAAEQKKDLALKEMQEKRRALLLTYEKSIAALVISPNNTLLDQSHQRMERLFMRGVVPSSLVIESHRSLVDFVKTRNERELKAMQILFDLQVLDGQTVEIKL